MALALCLLFDSRTDRLVRELWERLEARGIRTLLTHTHGRHHPHLSYAVLRAWDADAVGAAVAGLPDGGAVEVSVQGSLVFPRGRVSFACSVSADLAARQERGVAALTSTGADLHWHYATGRWVPHVSVATGASAEQLSVVTAAVSDVLPLTLHCDRASLIDSSTGEVWPLDGVP
ncbi:MAG TPA: 2'-5' RNA ligase family protein [Humibacillus xanthopallidus]|nr:2'-5' RNA ligase family protein [Humibacillus xanthopallidus]